jgi:hypothetical protein
VKLPAVVLGEADGVVRQVLDEEVFQGEGRKKADAKVQLHALLSYIFLL